MPSKAKLIKKKKYKQIKDIKIRLSRGEAVSFYERNIVNIYNKRLRTKRRLQMKLLQVI